MARTEKKVPVAVPPAAEADGYTQEQGPTLSIEQIYKGQELLQEVRPTLTPPTEVVRAEDQQGITAWHNSVKVEALWINSAQRNAWAAIQGVGWRRVTPANDSAFLNLTAMLSHAKQMNTACNVRIESDNLIHEVYVW